MNTVLPISAVQAVVERYAPGSNVVVHGYNTAPTLDLTWHDDKQQCRRHVVMGSDCLLLSLDEFTNKFADSVAAKYYNDAPHATPSPELQFATVTQELSREELLSLVRALLRTQP